jgi:hypothetical protein
LRIPEPKHGPHPNWTPRGNATSPQQW